MDALLPETPVGAIATLTSRDKTAALTQPPPRLFGGYLRKRYSSSMYMGS
ncbi:Phosphatidylinositol Kinase (PIK-G3), partial [Phytophthora palmivora]